MTTIVATFGVNKSTNATSNITVPTKVSELIGVGNYVTKTTTDNYLYIRKDRN